MLILFMQSRLKLTDDQESIFSIILSHIDNATGRLYTIDAPGESRKTILCNVLLTYARKQATEREEPNEIDTNFF